MKSAIIFVLCILGGGRLQAQTAQQLLAEGKTDELNFNVSGALKKYEAATRADPQLAEAWWRASRMLSTQGASLPNTQTAAKRQKYEQAQACALRAVALMPREPHALLARVIALGWLTQMTANPREKIRDAKIIREEAKKMILLDSAFAPAYFVLGQWHFELARLNWMEQAAVGLLFGGMPEDVSLEKALALMLKAHQLDSNAILYRYGKALVLRQQRKGKEAAVILEKAIQLPPREPDDLLRKENCRELLRELR